MDSPKLRSRAAWMQGWRGPAYTAHLPRDFSHRQDGSRCDFCGAARGIAPLDRVFVGPYRLRRCWSGCRPLPKPEVWLDYVQSNEWVLPLPFDFYYDAARCDWCGKPADRGIRDIGHHTIKPPEGWLTCCSACQGLVWPELLHDLDDPHPIGRYTLTGEPPEPPEFPTYVGSDGKEHGEYWG